MQHQKIKNYSFPAISILLGGFVGVFTFLNQPAPSGEQYANERFFRPAFFGSTTTYLVLSVGVNLKLVNERKKRKNLKFK
jgi:hypothetical protein